MLALAVILIMGNHGLTGTFGNVVSGVLFGLFGAAAYLFPFALFFITVFLMVNHHNSASIRKALSIFAFFLALSMFFQLFWHTDFDTLKQGFDGDPFWNYAREYHRGGGLIGGHLFDWLMNLTGYVGSVVIIITLILICFLLLTGKSILRLLTEGSLEAVSSVRDATMDAYEEFEERRERKRRSRERTERRGRRQVDENWHYMENTRIEEDPIGGDEMHELSSANEGLERLEEKILNNTDPSFEAPSSPVEAEEIVPLRRPVREIKSTQQEMGEIFPEEQQTIRTREMWPENTGKYEPYTEYPVELKRKERRLPDPEEPWKREPFESGPEEPYFEPEPVPEKLLFEPEPVPEELPFEPEPVPEEYLVPEETEEIPEREEIFKTEIPPAKQHGRTENAGKRLVASSSLPEGITVNEEETAPDYVLPPVSLLKKGKGFRNNLGREQEETSRKLEETLKSFGVNVKVTGAMQGPTVTRYELLPEAGVKVSKILSLTDDIKLALAAENVRIEAPIPGKSAVGIEVPNRDMQPVMLRDLLERDEFSRASSRIAFAAGMDIGGKAVVADIAKMPHLLIAGATGSGKSVCVNTIIMSILFKAKPDEVKLIMVDPKVVELSVYNGIPHLMLPVVTDPQKAVGALQWGVAEMEKRYNAFAELRVRKIEEYNEKAVKEGLPKMFQLIIIVDELADLMMTAKGDVENAIVRLAQKARAAGIHLIIATQRPSVNVVTGLIKANMPSRIAFAVTSMVDSRTILDMGGAEKLLGKGDMLFYPMGYAKPARVQGAFVSDEEVSDVAEFCRAQKKEEEVHEDISNAVESLSSSGNQSPSGVAEAADDGEDELFLEAAEFIVNLNKPTISIGALQRKFRLGWNRAARIMDQLHEEGIVGDESGTKGRSIVMSPEQFEEYKETH